MTILKSLIRIFFLEQCLDSFYSNFQSTFYLGGEIIIGDEIPWQALTRGMRLSKIRQDFDGVMWDHFKCIITSVSNEIVEFSCESYEYAEDNANPDFKSELFIPEGIAEGIRVYAKTSTFYL